MQNFVLHTSRCVLVVVVPPAAADRNRDRDRSAESGNNGVAKTLEPFEIVMELNFFFITPSQCRTIKKNSRLKPLGKFLYFCFHEW